MIVAIILFIVLHGYYIMTLTVKARPASRHPREAESVRKWNWPLMGMCYTCIIQSLYELEFFFKQGFVKVAVSRVVRLIMRVST